MVVLIVIIMNGNILKGKRTIKEAKMQMFPGAKNVKLILKKIDEDF